MRSPRFILCTGLGIGLFFGFVVAMAKAWMVPENDAAGHWAAIGIGITCAVGSLLFKSKARGFDNVETNVNIEGGYLFIHNSVP